MKAKLLSLFLSLIFCVAFPLSAPAESLPVQDTGDTSSPEETVTGKNTEPEKMTSDFLTRHREQLLSVSDEVLAETTGELLNFFWESSFLIEKLGFHLSDNTRTDGWQGDFRCHPAFRELVTRKDFLPELEVFAKKALAGEYIFGTHRITAILKQDVVRLLFEISETPADFPALQEIYAGLYPDAAPIADFRQTPPESLSPVFRQNGETPFPGVARQAENRQS